MRIDINEDVKPLKAMGIQQSWFFTFGCGIDKPHRNKYVEVLALDEDQAREKMESVFGKDFAMQYPIGKAAGVELYGLVHLATLW